MRYNPSIVTAYYTAAGMPEPVYEHRFHPVRRWRFDIAWPEYLVAIEVQGGTFVRGRHSRGIGQKKDFEKSNAAAVMGWHVLYCIPQDLMTHQMLEAVKTIIERVKK